MRSPAKSVARRRGLEEYNARSQLLDGRCLDRGAGRMHAGLRHGQRRARPPARRQHRGEHRGGGTTGGSGIGSVLLSDVRTTTGGVFNDNATLTVESVREEPERPGPRALQRRRARSVPGPLPANGRSQSRRHRGPVFVQRNRQHPRAAGGQSTVPIVVVRHVAMLEPPLANLTGAGASTSSPRSRRSRCSGTRPPARPSKPRDGSRSILRISPARPESTGEARQS